MEKFSPILPLLVPAGLVVLSLVTYVSVRLLVKIVPTTDRAFPWYVQGLAFGVYVSWLVPVYLIAALSVAYDATTRYESRELAQMLVVALFALVVMVALSSLYVCVGAAMASLAVRLTVVRFPKWGALFAAVVGPTVFALTLEMTARLWGDGYFG